MPEKSLKEKLKYCKGSFIFSISILLVSTFAIFFRLGILVFLMYFLNAPVIVVLGLFHLKHNSSGLIFAFYVLSFAYWFLLALIFKNSREQYRGMIILTFSLIEILSILFLPPIL